MTKGVASWGWSTVRGERLNGRVIWYTQAKVVGGSSSINAQLYLRVTRRTMTPGRRKLGCEGWSYRDVLPYLERAEDNQRLVNGTTATADRWAFPIRSIHRRSASHSCVLRKKAAFRSMMTSTGRCRTASVTAD